MKAHTLAEAMVAGTGVERPFLCPDHPDTRPSASYNVVKNVWYCYTCGSRGHGDEHTEASLDALQKYLWTHTHTPEIYPESWLSLYDAGDLHPYWLGRFSDRAVRHFRLGYDAERDAATYPLRDAGGRVIGVVRRRLGENEGPKYCYPYGVDIGDYLFNYTADARQVVTLTEGATDAIALWEAGVDAFAIYGSRMSARQVRLIDRVDPTIVLCAFDMDEAGANAYGHVCELLPHRVVARVVWDCDHGKDMNELEVQSRQRVVDFTLDMVEKRRLGSSVCGSSSRQAPETSERPLLEASSKPGRLRIKPSSADSKRKLILRAS